MNGQQVSHVSLRLDEEVERTLARRWLGDGDTFARDRLVSANQHVVGRLATRYGGYGCNRSDLMQEGNLGLLQAIDRFDPDRGVRLSTYASWWVRAYILRHVERNSRLVRGATTTKRLRLFYQLDRTKQKLAADGKEVTRANVAAALGVSEEDVAAMEALRRPVSSLDAPVFQDGAEGPRRLDRLADPMLSPEASLENDELRSQLDEALDRFGHTLQGRSLEMFRDRVATNSPTSLQELSERWGVSREAAKRVEQRVTRPLRRFLYREMGDTIVAALGSM